MLIFSTWEPVVHCNGLSSFIQGTGKCILTKQKNCLLLTFQLTQKLRINFPSLQEIKRVLSSWLDIHLQSDTIRSSYWQHCPTVNTPHQQSNKAITVSFFVFSKREKVTFVPFILSHSNNYDPVFSITAVQRLFSGQPVSHNLFSGVQAWVASVSSQTLLASPTTSCSDTSSVLVWTCFRFQASLHCQGTMQVAFRRAR